MEVLDPEQKLHSPRSHLDVAFGICSKGFSGWRTANWMAPDSGAVAANRHGDHLL